MKLLQCVAIAILLITPARGASLYTFSSEYYTFHTDLDRAFADETARRMDRMYEEYDRRFADFRPGRERVKFNVYLFRNKADYVKLLGPGSEHSGGMYSRSRKLLAAFLGDLGREELRRTLQHEAFHQFADANLGLNLPMWIQEGLAEVYGDGVWTGDGFLLGEVPPHRIRTLRADIQNGRLIDFRELMTISNEKWFENMADPVKSKTQYNQSWAMCHFLLFATDAEGNPKFRQRFLRMLHLTRTLDADSAFREAFSSNYKGFYDRFEEFALALRPTRISINLESQYVLADVVAEAHRRGVPIDDQKTFWRLAEYSYLTHAKERDPLGDPNSLGRAPFDRLNVHRTAGQTYPQILLNLDDYVIVTTLHQTPRGPDPETVVYRIRR
jgi:hypothetical protein